MNISTIEKKNYMLDTFQWHGIIYMYCVKLTAVLNTSHTYECTKVFFSVAGLSYTGINESWT